jgi:hypothetical protein
MIEVLVALGLLAGIVAAHEIGFWLGSLIRSAEGVRQSVDWTAADFFHEAACVGLPTPKF